MLGRHRWRTYTKYNIADIDGGQIVDIDVNSSPQGGHVAGTRWTYASAVIDVRQPYTSLLGGWF